MYKGGGRNVMTDEFLNKQMVETRIIQHIVQSY